MELSQTIGWIGFSSGFFISIPQILRTIKLKSTNDLSVTTFILIQITSACFLIRAVAIKELVFIAFYIFIFLSNTIQLFLLFKYRNVNFSKP